MPSAMSFQEAYDRGRVVWPKVALTFAQFCRHASRPEIAAEGLAERPEDLYLAFACLEGDPEALGHFEARCLAGVAPLLRRSRLDRLEIDEIVQNVRVLLLLDADAKLKRYSGRGALTAWGRVAAGRLALDFLKQRRNEVPSGSAVERVPEPGDTPELALLRGKDGQLLGEALSAALQGLSERDKTVLRLSYLDGLDIDEIGRVFRVHRATVARWLIVIRAHLAKQVGTRFKLEHNMSPSQLRSFVEVLRPDIALSLAGVLEADPHLPQQ
jgi:RNA polymerase sigma-70 factor (ECF subfamily)